MPLPQLQYTMRSIGGVMQSLPFVKQIRATQVVSQHSQRIIQSYKRDLQGSSWPLTKLDCNNPSFTNTRAKTILTNTHKAWGGQLSRLPKCLPYNGGVGSFYRLGQGYISQIHSQDGKSYLGSRGSERDWPPIKPIEPQLMKLAQLPFNPIH